ncbi:hypothetical protein SAMN05444161_9327 [Rhizobiales bacterium GAS191]|nr:hypothetical protein SAMN05444161_9327 [Rhizobiales bacterium GAS191]
MWPRRWFRYSESTFLAGGNRFTVSGGNLLPAQSHAPKATLPDVGRKDSVYLVREDQQALEGGRPSAPRKDAIARCRTLFQHDARFGPCHA